MTGMAQTVSRNVVKVVAMCVTKALGIVHANLIGMDSVVTIGVAIVVRAGTVTHPVADAVVVELVTMVNTVSCHVVRTASMDVIKILGSAPVELDIMVHHVIFYAVRIVTSHCAQRPKDNVLTDVSLAIGLCIVTSHVLKTAKMLCVTLQHLTVLMDVWLVFMERHARYYAVPHVKMMYVTKTRGNVTWDVGVDIMERTVMNHAVSNVKTRNATRIMQCVYPVQLVSMERCVTTNVQDIVLESYASSLLMMKSVPLVVKLVTMVQTVSSNVHKTVWITSVNAMEANVQHVCQEDREVCVMLVSICILMKCMFR